MLKLLLLKRDGRNVTHTIVEVEEDNFLKRAYMLIHCDTVDCVERRLSKDGKLYDLWVDDEGALKGNTKPTLATMSRFNDICEVIFGNVLVANHDEEGNTTTLTDEEIADIIKKLKRDILIEEGSNESIICYLTYLE